MIATFYARCANYMPERHAIESESFALINGYLYDHDHLIVARLDEGGDVWGVYPKGVEVEDDDGEGQVGVYRGIDFMHDETDYLNTTEDA